MNSEKCPYCGSENIMKGKIEAGYGVAYVPDGQKGLRKNASGICAYACKDCGMIFAFELTDTPNKITDR